jgi:hypothetical protein
MPLMNITKPVLKEALIISVLLLVYTWVAGQFIEPFFLEKIEAMSAGDELSIGDILLTLGSLFVVSYLGVFLMGFLVSWASSISISTLIVGLWIHTCFYYIITIVVLYFATEEGLFSASEMKSAFITGLISGTLVGALGYYLGNKLKGDEDLYY